MLFVAATFLILAQVQTQTGPQSIHVDLSAPPASVPPPTEGQFIRIAVAPVWSPERTYAYYDSLADYISTQSSRAVRIVQRHTYAEINALLREGTAEVGIICTGTYLFARRDGTPLDVIAVPLHRGEPHYYSLLLTRADSPYATLDDLEGRSFGFTDPLSLSGHFYPLSMLIDAQKDPRTYFSETTYTHNHDASMRAVRDGIVDAASVDSLVYEHEVERNPAWEGSLRVIHRSPPLAISPVVVPRSTDRRVRNMVEHVLLTMHETPRGREILGELRLDRFIAPPPGLFDDTAQIVDRVETYLRSHP